MVVAVMRNLLKAKPGQPKLNPEVAKPDDLQLALKYLAINHPERFHEVSTDQNINKKYQVDRLLSAGILNRIGNTIVDSESNAPLGNNINEVIIRLWDGKNTAQLNTYKAKLQNSGKAELIND